MAAIRRVALVVSAGTSLADRSDPNQAAWGRRLDVPFLSQWNMTEHKPERDRGHDEERLPVRAQRDSRV